MITEVASIRVKSGGEARFEAAARKAPDVFRRAEGCLGFALQRPVEELKLFRALIRWRTLDKDHSVTFRNGPLRWEWRALVGSSFAEPPTIPNYAPVFDNTDFA
jgi:heme-degrading monooxygenase HmoA